MRTPDPKYDEKFSEGARLERLYGLLLYGGPLIIAAVALTLIVDILRRYYGVVALGFVGMVRCLASFSATKTQAMAVSGLREAHAHITDNSSGHGLAAVPIVSFQNRHCGSGVPAPSSEKGFERSRE